MSLFEREMEFLILYYLCFLVFCWIYSHFSSCILIRSVKMVPAWCQGRTAVISMVVFCHFDAKMLFIRQPKNEKCIHLCTIRMQKYDNEKFCWAHNVRRRENLIGLYSFSFNHKLFAHSSVFKQIHSKIVGAFFSLSQYNFYGNLPYICFWQACFCSYFVIFSHSFYCRWKYTFTGKN